MTAMKIQQIGPGFSFYVEWDSRWEKRRRTRQRVLEDLNRQITDRRLELEQLDYLCAVRRAGQPQAPPAGLAALFDAQRNEQSAIQAPRAGLLGSVIGNPFGSLLR